MSDPITPRTREEFREAQRELVKQGGKAMQLWLTLLVAVLLGVLGWFANATIALQEKVSGLRNSIVKIQTVTDERAARIQEMYTTQQWVKEQLAKDHEQDLELKFRIQRLEERKP